MIGDISVFNWNFVIFIVISFTVGAITMIIYNRLKKIYQESIYHMDQDIIKAIISNYTHRLRNFEKIIAELRVKTDTMEMRLSQLSISQTPIITNTDATTSYQSVASQHQSHLEHPPISHVSETAAIMQPSLSVFENKADIHNNTIDHILKLLIERPRTSREIQHGIRRTREHTSRIMKKLYEANLVSRESNSKPFKYSISDAGRIQLKGRQKTSAADGMHSHVDASEFQLQTTV